MRVRRSLAAAGAVATGAALLALPQLPAQADPEAAARRPSRVVVIVVDQLRPEFIRTFGMKNVQALMEGGADYGNAYLGHLAAETVISHNVMTSGQLPKNMGWSDEWYRDTEGLLGQKDDVYVTGSMSSDQFDTLIKAKGYPKLPDYLHAAFPGKVVAAIGSKTYATYTMGGPSADMRITHSGRDYDCDGDGVNSWRGPSGTNVPAYLSSPVCGRFYINSDKAESQGTATTSPAWMYPLEGDRDVPGDDPAHQGGDVWTADAALKVMQNEDWSGLLLTFGGIDKAGHMWGGRNDRLPFPQGAERSSHLPQIARVADAQVGRIMDELKSSGRLEDTLVVLTTDHGQQQSKTFFGVDGPGRGNDNWYYGEDADETYLNPQPEIQRLVDRTDGNVRVSMQDSAIRTWLVDPANRQKKKAADVMSTLGGVIASYYRWGDHYVLRSRASKTALTKSEWQWFDKHAQELVDTQAASYGPDVIGLLEDHTNYGVKGDHGGAQKPVQRIPIVFAGAGVEPGATPGAELRSVDILPTVLHELGIPVTAPMDGVAHNVPDQR